MISWLSRHRPRRRGGKMSPKSPSSIPAADADLALVKISTGVSERPAAFRARRQDTDSTLVDGSDVYSDSDSSSLFDSDLKIPLTRCASPDSFDSLPLPKEPASHRAVKTNVNRDDPSLWKKSLQDSNHGPQCFGPVPLDCQPSVKAHRSKWSKFASGTTHSISTVLQASIIVGEASNIPYLKGLAGILLLISNSVQVRAYTDFFNLPSIVCSGHRGQ
ncbi:hypothetical protein R3P38DRAFT_651172 [Favolaschia claudopus]|uniref:Uncharacterized protein n=1 Tax=Favolaschia claudopus TaxID=2862362 RepID=A0AAW0E9M9_9AGAR